MMNQIDIIHGKVINFICTECAYVWEHEDGFKEVVYYDDVTVQAVA